MRRLCSSALASAFRLAFPASSFFSLYSLRRFSSASTLFLAFFLSISSCFFSCATLVFSSSAAKNLAISALCFFSSNFCFNFHYLYALFLFLLLPFSFSSPLLLLLGCISSSVAWSSADRGLLEPVSSAASEVPESRRFPPHSLRHNILRI